MKTRTMLILIAAPLTVLTAIILFRNYIPYALWLTETMGLKDAPTVDTIYVSFQNDFWGTLRSGSIITTISGIVLGAVKWGSGKFNDFMLRFKSAETDVSTVKQQLVGSYSTVADSIDEVKNEFTGLSSTVSEIKSDVESQIVNLKTSLQSSVGDIQALKEDAIHTTSTVQSNAAELLNLKDLLAEQQNKINVLLNTLQEKAKDPLISYR